MKADRRLSEGHGTFLEKRQEASIYLEQPQADLRESLPVSPWRDE